MKIFISADIEGISGVFHTRQTGENSAEYERAKVLMTEEVNAAIEGALAMGTCAVWVNDSHGNMRNILIESLHESAHLISGFPKPLVMMEGLDTTFDAVLLIGYHAMSKTQGILAHTINGFAFHSIKLNGNEYGEAEINAALAASFKVPVIMVSGDNHLRQEIKQYLPWAEFAEVKTARGARSADSLSPVKARQLIKEKVMTAIANVDKCRTFEIDCPIDLEVKLSSPLLADIMENIPGVIRMTADIVNFHAKDMLEVMKVIFTMSAASSLLATDTYR